MAPPFSRGAFHAADRVRKIYFGSYVAMQQTRASFLFSVSAHRLVPIFRVRKLIRDAS
jgi:hypothetical protein